jgi:hypothetical protein
MKAAAAQAARVVNGVPDELDGPTPCGDWDLRTLLNHTILWTSYSAERRAHGESVAEDLMSKDFTADPGFRKYQGFADPVQVPSTATVFEQALSLSGRDPQLS